MPSPILARADALMQRRRPSGGEFDEIPVLTNAVIADDDVPVLLDAEIQGSTADPEPTADTASPSDTCAEQALAAPNFDTALCDRLARELTHRVEQRITAELPRIIESTVRDFLIEQQMISTLPQGD